MLIEECVDIIHLLFVVDEYENANRAHTQQKVIEGVVLPGFLDIDDLII